MNVLDSQFGVRTTVTEAAKATGADALIRHVEDDMRQQLAAHIVKKRVHWRMNKGAGLWIAELRLFAVTDDELDELVMARLKRLGEYERYTLWSRP